MHCVCVCVWMVIISTNIHFRCQFINFFVHAIVENYSICWLFSFRCEFILNIKNLLLHWFNLRCTTYQINYVLTQTISCAYNSYIHLCTIDIISLIEFNLLVDDNFSSIVNLLILQSMLNNFTSGSVMRYKKAGFRDLTEPFSLNDQWRSYGKLISFLQWFHTIESEL